MLDTTGRRTVLFSRGWSINLRNKWRLSPAKKAFDHRAAVDEAARKFWKRCLADDHQQGNAVLNDGAEFIRFVTDAAIVGERDPAAFPDRLKPRLVRRIRREVIRVPLDCQTAGFENLRESFAEIAIGEIDKAQAARS